MTNVKLCHKDGSPCHPDCDQWSDCLDEDLIAICAAQAKRIKELESFIGRLEKSPHDWLKKQVKEILE